MYLVIYISAAEGVISDWPKSVNRLSWASNEVRNLSSHANQLASVFKKSLATKKNLSIELNSLVMELI